MDKLVIVFRGHSTANIIEDVRRTGILAPNDTLKVVCQDNDRLAESEDLSVAQAITAIFSAKKVVIIGNGGTTAQAVPIVARIAEAKGYANGHGLCECRFGTSREYRFEIEWEVVDLQPDGITHLAGDRIVTDTD